MFKFISLKSLLLSLILSSSLHAVGTTYSFLGLETGLKSAGDISAPSFGIKYGKQVDLWRSAISMDYAKRGSDTLTTFLLQADHAVMVKKFKNSKFKPYFGFNAGIIEQSGNVKDKGLLLGLNTGLTYLLGDNIDLDFGMRTSKTFKQDHIPTVHEFVFSLHYFY